ncbi:class D sortase [Geomicrobium sp. JCM 19039]|uniref:class D sortase n=1 Tax=Geomicrobium sp. JCM 19039 TaxID=1460636 RepID=UPI00045F457F|nr:class D sortase [Geomicrobium sp. JCM 19039]GAK10473.1 hypothetical protein JCM19039_87 [Geomicrobium sp. JCM 19039]
MIAGLLLVGVSAYDWASTKVNTDQALGAAVQNLEKSTGELDEGVDVEFSPQLGESVGVLRIPTLDVTLPIVEGTEEEMLAQGVGHMTSTVWPGQGEQILLSGHRDTAFRNFGQLQNGDEFIVDLSYGTFQYEMVDHEIVDKDDTTIIRNMGEEVLVLSTCYPFQLLGAAPERYVIYAMPVKELN